MMLRQTNSTLRWVAALFLVILVGETGCSQTDDEPAPTTEDSRTAAAAQFPGSIPADCEVVDTTINISSQSDLAEFEGRDCFVVTEHVFVRESADVVDLNALEGLHRVDGFLGIADNTALTTARLPNLIEVGEGLVVEGNSSLTTLQLDLFHQLDGTLQAFNNASLQSVGMPWLVDVGGSVQLTGLAALRTLDFQRLQTVGANFTLERLASLQCVCIPALSEVGGDFGIGFDGSLRSASAPSLSRVGGTVRVVRNLVLRVLELPALTTVGGGLEVSNNPQLAQCAVDDLAAQLTTLGGSELTSGNSETCPSTPLSPEDVGCASCTAGAPPPPVDAGTPDAGTPDTGAPDAGEFPGSIPSDCEVINTTINIDSQSDLAEFDGRDCFVVTEHVFVRESADVTDLSALEGLHRVDGFLGIADNSALTTAWLPNLIEVGQDVVVEGNTSLTSLDFDLLHDLAGTLQVFNNPSLQTIRMPWLVDVDGGVQLSSLASLTSLDLQRLQTVGSNFALERLAALQCVCLPALLDVGGDFAIRFDGSLRSASAPNLGRIGGSVRVERDESLQVLEMSALTTVGGDMQIANNAQLAQCAVDDLVAQLSALGGSVFASGNSATCPSSPLSPEDVGCSSCVAGPAPPPTQPDAGVPDTGTPDSGTDGLTLDSLSLRDNPNSELSAFLEVTTSQPSFVEVQAQASDHQFTLTFDSSELAERDQLLIGFRAQRSYQLTVRAFTSTGAQASQQLQYQTGALPAALQNVDVTVSQPAQMQPGITLFNLWKWDGPGQLDSSVGYIVGIDEEGEVVWYYQATHRPNPVIVLDNGNIAYQWGFGRIVIIDLAGNVLQTYRWDELGIDSIHHEVYEMPNGNLLTLSTELRQFDGYTDDQGNPVTYNVVGDVVVEFQRDGTVVRQLSLLDILDPQPRSDSFHSGFWDDWYADDVSNGTKDWSHANSVVYDPRDDSFVVSARHLNWAVKLDRQTGALIWRLGENGDFDLLSGQWFYHQHAVSVLDSGNILMFDNGNGRPGLQPGEFYSRAVEYSIDTTGVDPGAGTRGEASQVWEFRDDEPFYSNFISDADRLPNGNVLVTDGGRFGTLSGTENLAFARIVEVTGDANPTKVFEVYLRDFSDPQLGHSIYRSERVDLLEVLESR